MAQQGVQRMEANWLPPVAGLSYFEPPPGAYLATVVQAQRKPETRIRYGYRIGSLGLLVGLGGDSEVIQVPPISPLPGTPAGFAGLINLRGNLTPLYDLRQLLNLSGNANASGGSRNENAIVLGEGEETVALLIEEYPMALPELRPLPTSDFPLLPTLLAQHVTSGYVHESGIWLEFDYRGFFAAVCSRSHEPAAT